MTTTPKTQTSGLVKAGTSLQVPLKEVEVNARVLDLSATVRLSTLSTEFLVPGNN